MASWQISRAGRIAGFCPFVEQILPIGNMKANCSLKRPIISEREYFWPAPGVSQVSGRCFRYSADRSGQGHPATGLGAPSAPPRCVSTPASPCRSFGMRSSSTDLRRGNGSPFRQAPSLGGHVKRCERETTICYADRFIPVVERERTAEDGDEPSTVPFLKRFTRSTSNTASICLSASFRPSPGRLQLRNSPPPTR